MTIEKHLKAGASVVNVAIETRTAKANYAGGAVDSKNPPSILEPSSASSNVDWKVDHCPEGAFTPQGVCDQGEFDLNFRPMHRLPHDPSSPDATAPPYPAQNHPEKPPKRPTGAISCPAGPIARPATKTRLRAGDIVSRETADALMSPRPPYRQGKLDALCGIYTIFNAFVAATNHDPIPYFPTRKLFTLLIEKAHSLTGTLEFINWGLSYQEMTGLVRVAKKFYFEETGLVLDIVKPKDLFADLRYPKSETNIAGRRGWFERAAQTPGMGIILDIQAPWIWHWSALKGVTDDNRVMLFDSYGMRSISIEYAVPWRVAK